jgi:hypothetical protein
MAYDFLQASSRYFEVAVTDVALPITLSIRCRLPNTLSARGLFGVRLDSGTDVNRAIINRDFAAFQGIARNGGTSSGFYSVATGSSNTWQLVTAVFSATNSRTIYRDTTQGTTNTTSVTGITFDTMSIGRALSTTNTFTGQLADAALWDVALSADDINALSKGFKPFRVRPSNLKYYVPLVRDQTVVTTGSTLTATNSPAVFDHPRVY